VLEYIKKIQAELTAWFNQQLSKYYFFFYSIVIILII
jgi:hypothetical protein